MSSEKPKGHLTRTQASGHVRQHTPGTEQTTPAQPQNPCSRVVFLLQEVYAMKPLKHWTDAVNAVLGVWLVVSPWLMGYQDASAAMWNAVIVGAALVAAALGAIFVPRAWEEWTEGGLAVWLVASPWLLGFAAMEAAMLTAVATGVVIFALALWTLTTDSEYNDWWHKATGH
jgi:hypothetical protein